MLCQALVCPKRKIFCHSSHDETLNFVLFLLSCSFLPFPPPLSYFVFLPHPECSIIASRGVYSGGAFLFLVPPPHSSLSYSKKSFFLPRKATHATKTRTSAIGKDNFRRAFWQIVVSFAEREKDNFSPFCVDVFCLFCNLKSWVLVKKTE